MARTAAMFIRTLLIWMKAHHELHSTGASAGGWHGDFYLYPYWEKSLAFLGSIISRLASPTRDGMKHPKIHIKVKVRIQSLEVKKNVGWKKIKKKKTKTKVNSEKQKLFKIAQAAQKSHFRGEGGLGEGGWRSYHGQLDGWREDITVTNRVAPCSSEARLKRGKYLHGVFVPMDVDISYGTKNIPKRTSSSEVWPEVLVQTLYILLGLVP